MVDNYGYPIPKDTPAAIKEACIPRSYWWNGGDTEQRRPLDGYHPIPQQTRDMYDYGCGHTIPATPETPRALFPWRYPDK